jgi:hypothetical protein
MSFENFNQELIRQVDQDIFLDGREPFQDLENPRFEYGFFLFTKWNEQSGIEWEIPNLENDWNWVGASWLGDWRENQFGGPGPIDNLYRNEMLLRSYMNELVSRGVLTDFKIRYRYPTLPR